MQAYSAPSSQSAAQRVNLYLQQDVNEDLFRAIQYADEADAIILIEKALEKGANIHALNSYGHGAIELAVIYNKVRVFKYLLAKNALPPDTRPDEFDLLMHTAVHGQTEMGEALIEEDCLNVIYSDVYGMTALHHAVRNRQVETARMLLDHGADLNAMTVGLPRNQVSELFGDAHNLTGDNITPMMIAIAQGDHEMVKLFISYNEDIAIGAIHPFLLALKNSDAQMLHIMLEHIDYKSRNFPSNKTLLNWAIQYKVNKNCLQIVLEIYPLSQNNPDYNQFLLQKAIRHGNHVAAAMFIEQGIHPENHHPDAIVWEQAAGIQDGYKMLTLLSHSASAQWKNLPAHVEKKSLGLICQTEPGMAAYARIGICPLVAKLLINRAAPSAHYSIILNQSQKINDMALFFAESLTSAEPVIMAPGNLLQASSLQSGRWPNDFPDAHSAEQVIALKKMGQALLQDYLKRLTGCLHYDYLSESGAQADFIEEQIILIKQKLETEPGVPSIVAAHIARAWEASILLRSSTPNDAYSSVIETSEFIFQLKRNIDTILTDLPDAEKLAKLSFEAISKIVPDADTVLPELKSDPASALRTLENRSNLQDVDLRALQAALGRHYAIPPKLAEILAQCWSTAISEVRQADHWQTPLQMHLALKTALSAYLRNKLQSFDAAFAPGTVSRQREILQALLGWCAGIQSERSESPGKRGQSAQPAHAPSSKKPRNE